MVSGLLPLGAFRALWGAVAPCPVRLLFHPLNSVKMAKDVFKLSPRLRDFLRIGSSSRSIGFGVKYPISIRRRSDFNQTVWIFPESDYPFFLGREVRDICSLAELLGLSCSVFPYGNLVLIHVDDYLINR